VLFRSVPEPVDQGGRVAFLAGAGLAALGLAATLALIRSRDSRAHTELGAVPVPAGQVAGG